MWATGKGEPRRPGSSATASTDGRFQLELDPGDYQLGARADGHATASVDVTISGDGAPEVRLHLARGETITGRVVDERGRGVGLIHVMAGDSRDVQGALSLPDGSFAISGLGRGPFSLVAGSPDGRFAVAHGVSPGKEVVITLGPGSPTPSR